MSPSRSILLVGEGNFSFSSSVCGSESGSSVTATCPQRQEEALRHEGAAANILNIKDSGGAVLFEVDCTKLGECPPLQGRVFDRVVFNFPHCGRKSGVKKNRELLRNFFLSCVQVLAEDGEVHVSLCNGQGGTPADQPMRERHNSWQVVAMAAEAHLILSAVCPFESENHQSYKCTGYRSQDKGFHVEKALLHVFARSAPYTPVPEVHMEEVVEGEKVHYNVPSELSDHLFRKFLCSDSIHPVKLVQDFLLAGLAEDWSVSMTAESESYLVAAKRLQTCCHGVDASQFYWIHQLQKDLSSPAEDKDPGSSNTADASGKESRTRRGAESLRPAFSLFVNPEVEGELYLLRPSLLLQLEELLTKREEIMNNKRLQGINEGNKQGCEAEINKDEALESCNGISGSLFGFSGVVFRNVPISLWALPAFHQLLLRAVVPSHTETIKKLGHKLEKLLAPYGVSMVTEDGGLRLTAQPMGLVGQVFVSDAASNHATIIASLNLDLLAALLFSLPDWRLLWCHDSRFIKQFSLPPPPGTPFRPFSLFPESFSFDISFWSGPAWEEKLFHAAVREASHGTVEQVKLVDTFSHPDLSQTSFCYRLTYRSHTHAVSHTQALTFHKQLQLLLASRLQLTIR